MIRNTNNILKNIVLFTYLICLISCKNQPNDAFSEVVKVSFRNVGHHLLLANQDSTSLVKPIVAINNKKFQLSFENDLAIHPDSLVNQIKSSFKKSGLPQYYLVEVIQCKDNEVAYSYEVKQNIEKGIIPCGGRILKKSCYFITVRFTKIPAIIENNNSNILYIIGFSVLAFLIFLTYKKKKSSNSPKKESNFASLGHFKFYPEQNKLVKETVEISLSKKECELLAIFIANPNQIIKRDELTKRVWEDNGVIVGRSLDTYISKLRKKLKDDESIKLTNIHGIGYKLEVS